MRGKKILEQLSNNFHLMVGNFVDYIKDNFDEHGEELLEKSTGTIGLVVKLFGQPIIDKYFEKQQNSKLENLGFYQYLKAAIIQATESLQEIEEIDTVSKEIFDFISAEVLPKIEEVFLTDIFWNFNPKYHPASVIVKKQFLAILTELEVTIRSQNEFVNHFNRNLEQQIRNVFGELYSSHLNQVNQFYFSENETAFLFEMVEIGTIGFQEGEDLHYEESYGEWTKLSSLLDLEVDYDENEIKEIENRQRLISELIEEYFVVNPNNHLGKILFIIGDFGKGKSVFLRNFASKLAKSYLTTYEGLFPVYFNLRNFNKYSDESRLGVIDDYLIQEFQINIDDEYFRKKEYIFLIDSLDESGELSGAHIEKVIRSIRNIQNIDKSKYVKNRIIVCTRPINVGLITQINRHEPFEIKNDENRGVPHFISIFGYKRYQFNNWIVKSLESRIGDLKFRAKGLGKKIINAVKEEKEIDIYKELLKNETLSTSELRRPIFAYMILQLLVNNINFSKLGKVGVYLSFLNLLTREAKHIQDTRYVVSLTKGFAFRNLLHAIASLWQYERISKESNYLLNKANICRVVAGDLIAESDIKVLELYKEHDISQIQFLSHSYFGEKDNTLSFQHQSFAEVLLAEYYLKIFIKYGLDEQTKVEEARQKLILGEPTRQTIDFLWELLTLLKEVATSKNTKAIKEKRKLLAPMLASLGTKENNKIYSDYIFYNWFNSIKFVENTIEFPETSLSRWPIREKEINRIISFAIQILESQYNYSLVNTQDVSSLFNYEGVVFSGNALGNAPDIDKWLAFLVGNILFEPVSNSEFFNKRYSSSEVLIPMLRNWNSISDSTLPGWTEKLFKGCEFNNVRFRGLFFHRVDFSSSVFNNSSFRMCHLGAASFRNCTFESVSFDECEFYNTELEGIEILGDGLSIEESSCLPGISFPEEMLSTLKEKKLSEFVNFQKSIFISSQIWTKRKSVILRPLEGLLKFCHYRKNISKDRIQQWYDFEDPNHKYLFEKWLSEILAKEI